MQNYKEIFSFEDLEAIKDLMEEISPDLLPRKIKDLSDYLREGYKYAANVKDDRVKKIDITQHVDLIHTLCRMADDMLKVDENSGWAYRMPDGKAFTMDPFFDFCDSLVEVEWTDLVDNLEELMEVLANYANESNVWNFKECSFTLKRLHFLFSRLNNRIQNN